MSETPQPEASGSPARTAGASTQAPGASVVASNVPPDAARAAIAARGRAAGAHPDRGVAFIAHAGDVGAVLAHGLDRLIATVPGMPTGTVAIARHLGLDKVLISRLLTAMRAPEPLSLLRRLPGPEPLSRFIQACGDAGADGERIADATRAVEGFATLIRETAGDRSGFDTMLSGLVPEMRAEFELRRKQAAFRAMSQLRGVVARTNLACAMLQPSATPGRLDVAWVFGTLGLQRLRDDATVKFASRRIAAATTPRRPRTLDGDPISGVAELESLRLDRYCSTPPPRLVVHASSEVLHYALADHGFGPDSSVDLVFAEVNIDEIDRYASAPGRLTYFFAEVPIPVETLVFDVLVRDDVFPDQDPSLIVYDTILEGVASPNDRARDLDRLDLVESIVALGHGVERFRSSDIPLYGQLLDEAFSRLGWDGRRFRGWRSRIAYPMYGSQITMAFDAPHPGTTGLDATDAPRR